MLIEKSTATLADMHIYFQMIWDTVSYNVYEGVLDNWYSHGTGANCDVSTIDEGNGYLRYDATTAEGNRYYLVTGKWSPEGEGPSGYASDGDERDPSQNTCP
ncbi:MAG: hypothetical protein ACFFC7_33980 [Candidatus Hermodarchaeota archaeon]